MKSIYLIFSIAIIRLLVVAFILPTTVFAKVVINEILPHPSSGSDWIELHNTELVEIDISGWQIEDSKNTVKTFPGDTKISSVSSFLQVFVSNRLNNGGDIVRLKDESGVIVDEKKYDEDPGINISIGRYPDGKDNWAVLSSSTPNNKNTSFAPTFTSIPLPTVTPIPTERKEEFPTSSLFSISKNHTVSKKPPISDSIATKTIGKKPTLKSDIIVSGGVESGSVLGEFLGQSTDSGGKTENIEDDKKNSISLIPICILAFLGASCFIIAAFLSFRKIKEKHKT